MVSDYRTVKACHDLLHLVKPELLHIGSSQYGFAHYCSVSSSGSSPGDGIHIQWGVLYCLIWYIFPEMNQVLLLCLWVHNGYQALRADLGDLVPEILLAKPPWVGANSLRLWLYSYDPQRRMCHQITHGNGRKHAQFLCLIIGPLIMRGIVGVQDILKTLPLVPIWVDLMALPVLVILGQRRGSPRCGSL